jgi:hypothetical protein
LPLELDDRTATLTGTVTVHDVEPFVAWLRSTPKGKISLRNCTHLHTGVFQALLLFQPKVSVAPHDGFLATWVLPLLNSSGSGTTTGVRNDHRTARR